MKQEFVNGVNDLRNTFDELCELKDLAYSKARKLAIDFLKEQPDNRFDLDEIVDEYMLETICVTYDGGNHPEYEANPYSVVHAIRLEEDAIVFEIDETDEYYEDNVSCDEFLSAVGTILDYAINLK